MYLKTNFLPYDAFHFILQTSTCFSAFRAFQHNISAASLATLGKTALETHYT